MDNYILSRLRIDASHLLARALHESQLQHQGVKGRFRELLINDILIPWLPPYVSCGTGMVIAAENKVRQFTQDDIVVYDRSLVPPVLATSNNDAEGIFLYNSVIMRIEVKSTLTRDDIRRFVSASLEGSELLHTVQPGVKGLFEGAYNLLFAYGSDAEGKGDSDFQLRRVFEVMREQGCDPLSGKISMVCIPAYGFWKLGLSDGERCWQSLSENTPEDRVSWFVGCVSNACFQTHALRQGRDPTIGLEGGIGMYLMSPFDAVPSPY
ncbi:MAG: DUF6602 domain-containing protein [Rhodopila sp.]